MPNLNRRRPKSPAPLIQPLEGRRMMSATPTVEPSVSILASSSTVTGYTPAQITAGYGLAGLTFGSTSANGAGQTIAIVDAYNDPNLAADLVTFDKQFGLATASLSVVSETGSTTDLPETDAGWAQEISLDVEWAHAVAPGAKILLVEATSDSTEDLMAAVDYARNAAGVSVVSMSWGTSEFYTETDYDSDFTTPSGHIGVTFVAAAGDDGSSSGAEWPAAAAGVLSVGGTTLTLTSSGAYGSETGWSDGGGGSSVYEGEATFQYAVQRTGYRTTPDVAWDASVSTGVAVYDSLADDGSSGWLEFGGTSAGTPQWGALIAIADQGRTINGLSTLDGATNTLPTLYGLYGHKSLYDADFNDVTSGSTSYAITAGTGYDEVSGIGTPKGSNLIAALVRSTASTTLKQTTVTITAPVNQPPGHPHGWIELPAGWVDPRVGAIFAEMAAPEWPTTVAALSTPATFGVGGFDVGGFDVQIATTAAAAVTFADPASTITADGNPTTATPGLSVGVASAVLPTAAVTGPSVEVDAVRALPVPADFVAAGLPPATVAASSDATALVADSSRRAGVGVAVAGAAVALWFATEPARARRRETADDGSRPLMIRHLIASGLLRG